MANEKTNKPFYTKKWFIIVVAILVLAAIGKMTGSGDKKKDDTSKDTKKVTEEVKETKAPEKVEITEEMKADFSTNINDVLNAKIALYDNYQQIWSNTLTGIGEGTITTLDGYNTMKELKDVYAVLSNDINKIEAIKGMSSKQKDDLKETKSSFRSAISQNSLAVKKMLKMLDKGEVSNKELSKIQTNLQLAQEDIIEMAAYKATMELDFGLIETIEPTEVQQ